MVAVRPVDVTASVDDTAMQVVGVVMMVMVDRQRARILAEKLDEGRITADLLGMARAADMVVEADNLVGRAHDQVEIMGHHQYAATVALAQAGDEAVKLGLPGHVDALNRLVEHKQRRGAEQGARQQHTLQLTTGNALQRAIDHTLGAYFFQCRHCSSAVDTRHQPQESPYRQRQRSVDLQLLRHVADRQPGLAPNRSAAGFHQAENTAHQRCLASTIGADERDNFAGAQGQVHILQNILLAESNRDVLQRDQRVAHAALHPAHSPMTSTVWPSTLKPSSRALRSIASLIGS